MKDYYYYFNKMGLLCPWFQNHKQYKISLIYASEIMRQ